MHKTSSLSELGFDAGDASSGFFRAVADGCPITHTSSSAPHRRLTKVSVIGAGNVGMAIAQTILTQNLADEIALVDALPDKLRGEALDLQHAAAFLPRVRIVSGTDAAVTKNSDLVVVTAGARQIPGETRLNLLQRNVALYRKIVPPVAEHSPDALLLVVSNPVDVLTYVAWKLSGSWPAASSAPAPTSTPPGSGSSSPSTSTSAQDAAIYRIGLQAYMVGEHGDSSVAIWSSISVAACRRSSRCGQPPELRRGGAEGIRRAVVGAPRGDRPRGTPPGPSATRGQPRDVPAPRPAPRAPVSVLAAGFHGISDGHEVFSACSRSAAPASSASLRWTSLRPRPRSSAGPPRRSGRTASLGL
ncbi:hypothetical protein ZWY2020_005368 [Hordeum vulgare]|nr:hypothetical protein ZWY2020_005368 [Hordeum vulgare]